MITWIQQSVFKHQRVLFGILLTIVVIAFVFMGGAGNFLGEGRGPKRVQFFGLELNDPRIRAPLERNAMISQMLNFRQSSAVDRAAQLALCDRFGIADPGAELLKEHIAKVPGLQNNGTPDKARLTSVIEFAKMRLGLSEKAAQEALNSTLAEDWRIAQLEKVLGSTSFLLPSEALARAKDKKTVRSVDVAELSFSEYTAKNPVAEPDAKTLEEYFKKNAATYAIPAKPRHSVVVFEGEKLVASLAKAPEEAELKAYFDSHKARYEVKVEPPKLPVEPSFETSREMVLYDLTAERLKSERDLAAQSAVEGFLDGLSELKGAHKAAGFQALVEKHKGRLINLPPLSPDDAVPAPLIAAEFQRASVLVTETEPFGTKPLRINGGFGVLFYEGTEPGRDSKLEEVKGKVLAEWKETEGRTAWDKAVNAARGEIVKAVAAGTSFKEAAEKAGFKVTAVEDFTVSSVPVPSLRSFLVSDSFGGPSKVSPLVAKLKQGETSANSGGRIVHVRKLNEPALTPASPEVAEIIASESADLAQTGYQNTVREIVTHEMERINPKAKEEAK